jgi:hypothetical protein
MATKRRNKNSHKREHRFRVRGVRRDPPDIKKLSKALIALAMAEAEREAQAEQSERTNRPADASNTREQTSGGLDE